MKKDITKNKIWNKTWFTILMLIVFFPLGIFTMFRYKKFNKVVRIIIIGFFAIILCNINFWEGIKAGASAAINDNSNVIVDDINSIKDTTISESSLSTNESLVDEKTTKEKIESAIPSSINNITRINYTDSIDGEASSVLFVMDLKDGLTLNMMYKSAYLNAKDIIKAVNAVVGDKISSYQFMFNGELTDTYGNTSTAKVLSFGYDSSTINRINWDKITTDNFISLAQNEFKHNSFK